MKCITEDALRCELRANDPECYVVPEGKILTEELPKVTTCHENFFENYIRAYHGEEDFLVKIPETRRVLALMDAVRESGRTGKSVEFE